MKQATREWLEKADEDLRAVQVLMSTVRQFDDTICFHCQQAVEKQLKAVMCELGLAIPRIHDLTILAKLLKAYVPQVSRFRRRLSDLSEYAVEYRYPAKRATPEQAKAAQKYAEQIRHVCDN